MTDQTTEYPPATLTPAPRPGALADKDEVLAATEEPTVRIIDVLPPESYEGLFAMYDRPGHIASAVNEPMGAISGDGFSLKSTEEIESGLGGSPDQRAITYCGAASLPPPRRSPWCAPATPTSPSTPAPSRSGPRTRPCRWCRGRTRRDSSTLGG